MSYITEPAKSQAKQTAINAWAGTWTNVCRVSSAIRESQTANCTSYLEVAPSLNEIQASRWKAQPKFENLEADFLQCFDPICLSIICYCFASFSAFRQRFSGDSRSSVTRPHFWSSRWIGGSAIRGYLHIRHANKLVPTTEARFDPILVLNLYPQPCFRSPFVLHTLSLLKAVIGGRLVGRRSAHACLRSLPHHHLGFSFFWSDRTEPSKPFAWLWPLFHRINPSHSPRPGPQRTTPTSISSWTSLRRRQLSRCDKQIFCIYVQEAKAFPAFWRLIMNSPAYRPMSRGIQAGWTSSTSLLNALRVASCTFTRQTTWLVFSWEVHLLAFFLLLFCCCLFWAWHLGSWLPAVVAICNLGAYLPLDTNQLGP